MPPLPRQPSHALNAHAEPERSEQWTLYLLRCCDGSLYAGITNDLARRLAQHQDGRASRYTRGRRPVSIVYREPCASRSEALQRECAVKALSREAKERLIVAINGMD